MVVASIDLLDGKAVQLRRGKEKVIECDDTLALAQRFNQFGEIAVIDLNAAMGKGNNRRVIKELLEVAECRVGGGIRTIEEAVELLSLGARKIIIGSVIIGNNQINKRLLNDFAETIGPQRIIIAVDSMAGEVVVNGWTRKTGFSLTEVISEVEDYCSEFLCTFVEREGMMQGIDLERVRAIRNLTTNRLTVAGGVRSLEEIKCCAELDVDLQIGMAFYTGRIDPAEAFIESLNWRTDLIPIITQDTSGQVLMCAYSNKDSLKKTFETGLMWYFSRSRNRLWMKGEHSKNIQRLIKIRADCDRDTLLAAVIQTGGACHLGTYSCFGDKDFNIERAYEIIRQRLKADPLNFCSKKLFNGGIDEKKMTKIREIIPVKDKNRVLQETADLMYFLILNLAKEGIPLRSIYNRLRR